MADRNAQQPAQDRAGAEIACRDSRGCQPEAVAAQEGSGATRACASACPWRTISAPVDASVEDAIQILTKRVAGYRTMLYAERKAYHEWARSIMDALGVSTALIEDVVPHAAALKANLEAETDMRRACKAAIVHTVGGLVEGSPTSEVNYLQRLRELVRVEEQHRKCGNPIGSDLLHTAVAQRDAARDEVERLRRALKRTEALVPTHVPIKRYEEARREIEGLRRLQRQVERVIREHYAAHRGGARSVNAPSRQVIESIAKELGIGLIEKRLR